MALSKGKYALAVCDKCRMQFKYSQLIKDGAFPGMWVCRDCYDIPDPHLNAPMIVDNIGLDHARPDVLPLLPEYHDKYTGIAGGILINSVQNTPQAYNMGNNNENNNTTEKVSDIIEEDVGYKRPIRTRKGRK